MAAASTSTKVFYGLYNDEEDLKDAVRSAKAQHLEIMDVYTPFPVHGLDPIVGLQESRLHYLGFIYGSIGALFGFLSMSWIFTRDWPTMFGGKPFWAVPSFIPITFEFTVLLAAVGMVITFYIINGLGPGVENPYLDPRITDDKFCIAFDVTDSSEEEIESIKQFL